MSKHTNIDWSAVQDYYLRCRSFANTARHFGLKADSVRKRAARYGWEQDKSGQETDKTSDICPQIGQNYADKEDSFCPKNGQIVPSSEPSLPALQNLTSQTVYRTAPWTMPSCSRLSLPDKASCRAYIQHPDTKDCLYSGFIGLSANLRIGRENPPSLMVAIVADYDMPMTQAQRARALKKLATPPNYVSVSYSGGTHALWLLDSPLPLPADETLVENVLKEAKRDLKLGHAFGELDSAAFTNPAQYYQLGWEWERAAEEPLKDERTRLWLSRAIDKTRSTKRCPVPMERIALEVEKRFPGRWSGNFCIGARGLRFWDPAADNDTAAIVTEHGMVCFTGPQPFMPWEAIFGKSFFSAWEEDSMGRILKDIYCVNNTFYVNSVTTTSQGERIKEWLPLNRQNLESLLTTRYGLRNRASRDEDCSEVKQAVGRILQINQLNLVAPFIYNPDLVVRCGGLSCLNSSFVRVLPPDMEQGHSWGDGFPWIARFLEQLFPDEMAREHFVAEWAYAYRNAYHHQPRNGHIIFVAGEPGCGKNFLTEVLYGPSLGGFADASDYLLGKSKFNASLFKVGVWACNDSVANFDRRDRKLFTANLKKQAANFHHVCEDKFKSATSLPWEGRVIITLNTDPLSLELLPQTDTSSKDKMCFFRTGNTRLKDPLAASKARDELPALCAYLLRYEIPEACADPHHRWGVNAYHDEMLLTEATDSNTSSGVAEVLATFARSVFEADPKLAALEDTASGLLSMMPQELRSLIRGADTAISFGRALRAMEAAGTFPITAHRRGMGRIYTIRREQFQAYINSELAAELPRDHEEGGPECPF